MQQVQQVLQVEIAARRQRDTLGGKTRDGKAETAVKTAVAGSWILAPPCSPAGRPASWGRWRGGGAKRRDAESDTATTAQSVLPGTGAEPRLRPARRKRAGEEEEKEEEDEEEEEDGERKKRRRGGKEEEKGDEEGDRKREK